MFFQFDDEIHAYQNFVKQNINILGNIVLISEQLYIKNIKTNKTSFIDMLALDLKEKRLIILELKNTIARDGIIGQSIKYYDFILNSSDLLKELLFNQQNEINISLEEINYYPKVLLIVPDFEEQVLRSLLYIKDIDIEVIKFNAIQKDNYFEIIKEVYEPQECYDELEFKIDTNKKFQIWDINKYLLFGFDEAKIKLLKQFLNFMSNLCFFKNKKINYYFYENKITIIIDKKIWAYIIMKRQLFDNLLELNINLAENQFIDYCGLRYSGQILNYKILNKGLKIRFSQIPTDFIDNLL